MDKRNVIACVRSGAEYPSDPPFHPGEAYAEYALGATSSCANDAYETVRECFRLAGLDAAHLATAAWNPMRDLIQPGETVLLKPNLVKERHPRDPSGWRYVLTHGSVIRAVADYVFKALGGDGKVVIADAPQTDSSFAQIRRRLGLDAIRDFYRRQGLACEIVDLRKEEWVAKDEVIVQRKRLDGDPIGYVAFDLGDSSEFVGHSGEGRYYGADYDAGEVNRHHSGGRHEYLIAGTAIQADVVFSLPKLKTHKKAGVTVSLKNLIGVNGDKNWLPHHTEAGSDDPGDEHPRPGAKHRAERTLVRQLRNLAARAPGVGPWILRQARRVGRHVFGDTEEVIRSGNWWGNDTVWRTCLDLNKIILYGSPDGSLRRGTPEHRKRHFVLVDGIVAGEGRGPMNPDPVAAGTVVFGIDAPSVDAACAWLMGFDPQRIPIVRQAFRCTHYPLSDWDWPDVRLISNRPEWCGPLPEIRDDATFHFMPHFGWKGHVERVASSDSEGKPGSDAS
ncbi:MAG: DUF362 domain-containing protein [Pirellulales bacterium]|nr:DUF362 domain-containing protein [Pirellulales bacterium]